MVSLCVCVFMSGCVCLCMCFSCVEVRVRERERIFSDKQVFRPGPNSNNNNFPSSISVICITHHHSGDTVKIKDERWSNAASQPQRERESFPSPLQTVVLPHVHRWR